MNRQLKQIVDRLNQNQQAQANEAHQPASATPSSPQFSLSAAERPETKLSRRSLLRLALVSGGSLSLTRLIGAAGIASPKATKTLTQTNDALICDAAGSAELSQSAMSGLQVYIELPDFIKAGFRNGTLERVGGVIRYSDSEQVIAWLRECGQIVDDLALRQGVLDDVLSAVGLTATTLSNILGALIFPVVDIALAGYHLLVIIEQVERQSQAIEKIYERIEQEFAQDRFVELEAAIITARRLPKFQDVSVKRQQVGFINQDLQKARGHFLYDCQQFLLGEMKAEDAERALRYLILAMQITIMAARCWLEVNEFDSALDWLCCDLQEVERLSKEFINVRLGERRAYFFHKYVNSEDFDRYLNIERWLRGKRNVLRDIIEDNRDDFWEGQVVEHIISKPILGIAGDPTPVDPPPYAAALLQSEILIENYQRLRGFLLELRSMCLPFSEWDSYDGTERIRISEQTGYVMLVQGAAIPAQAPSSASD